MPFTRQELRFTHTLQDVNERALAKRFRGSPFDPASHSNHPTILSPQALVADIRHQLGGLELGDQVFDQLLVNLNGVDTTFFQRFFAWSSDRGHTGEEAPPSWRPQRDRALAAASIGCQRAPRGID